MSTWVLFAGAEGVSLHVRDSVFWGKRWLQRHILALLWPRRPPRLCCVAYASRLAALQAAHALHLRQVFRHNDAAHLDAILRNSIAEGQPRSHRPWKKVEGVEREVFF